MPQNGVGKRGKARSTKKGQGISQQEKTQGNKNSKEKRDKGLLENVVTILGCPFLSSYFGFHRLIQDISPPPCSQWLFGDKFGESLRGTHIIFRSLFGNLFLVFGHFLVTFFPHFWLPSCLSPFAYPLLRHSDKVTFESILSQFEVGLVESLLSHF